MLLTVSVKHLRSVVTNDEKNITCLATLMATLLMAGYLLFRDAVFLNPDSFNFADHGVRLSLGTREV